MAPELVRLLIIILCFAIMAFSAVSLVVGILFGFPTRVPTPPLPPRKSKVR